MKEKTKLTQRLFAKIMAFFVLILSAIMLVACVVCVYVLVEEDIYMKDKDQVIEENFYGLARNDGYNIVHNYSTNGESSDAFAYAKSRNVTFELFNDNEKKMFGNYENIPTKFSYSFVIESGLLDEEFTVKVYLNEDNLPVTNDYYFTYNVITLLYSLRYSVFAIAIVCVILIVSSFSFLMCAAGRRKGQQEIAETNLTRIPFDILTFIILMVAFVFYRMVFYSGDEVLLVFGGIPFLIMCTLYCMSFAVRVKLGVLWKNTVIARFLKFFKRSVVKTAKGIMWLTRNISLVWKMVFFVGVVIFVQLVSMILCFWEMDNYLIVWAIETWLLLHIVFYITYLLVKLQKGGEMFVNGDLSYKVDTSRMFGAFKKHGENLNNIALGMNQAVEERMKSERLKTELITNVSHDIKTPLTSIINYSDLISKEETDNPAITEYAEVLYRQSDRLKKLIEDLMEASKAVTGNVEVQLLPCEVGVLLTQTVGEYEQRLQEGDLELITKQPEEVIHILADGRLLWRVFDNLMNNICKYAQNNTRVYLSVEEKDGKALISFKNISKYSLDISMEELMERFVRGDQSRNTEGNGLGLSIASNLVELQNGTFDLTIDGDLFKVVLGFPILKPDS